MIQTIKPYQVTLTCCSSDQNLHVYKPGSLENYTATLTHHSTFLPVYWQYFSSVSEFYWQLAFWSNLRDFPGPVARAASCSFLCILWFWTCFALVSHRAKACLPAALQKCFKYLKFLWPFLPIFLTLMELFPFVTLPAFSRGREGNRCSRSLCHFELESPVQFSNQYSQARVICTTQLAKFT